ncbi:MAG: hypothetical protein GF317_12130, partial [Candidatus Lokiarchaeota archaeon]|nr:hypothetical protein [Candidatus Lokiarchaeota archaeon]MBD3200396.1 hypothetical protein [Candidatus Lokiarchaeota archaeon]
MNKKVIVVGELHQDLYYENEFYSELTKSITSKIVNFIRYNPNDLINSKLIEKLVKAGFSSVPKKIIGKGFIIRGGNGNNSSECMAKLDIPVKLVSVVGGGSNWMKKELSKFNVDIEDIYKIDEITPISTIIKADFTTKIHLAPNLKMKMNFDNINISDNIFKNAKIAFFTPFAEKFVDLYNLAQESDPIIAINIERQKIKKLSELNECIRRKCDLMFINLGDARLISNNEGSTEVIDMLFRKYGKIRIYTDGKNGSHIFGESISPIKIPSKEVEVINRTGAGDCYSGGFLGRLYELITDRNHFQNLLTSDQSGELRKLLRQCAENGTNTALFKISHQSSPKL